MLKALAAGAMALALAGCATAPHGPAGGRTETEEARRVSGAKAAVARFLSSRGYSIVHDSGLQVVAEKDAKGFGTASRGFPKERVTVTLISSGSGDPPFIVSRVALVRNGGTAFEQATPLTDSRIGAELQAELDALRK